MWSWVSEGVHRVYRYTWTIMLLFKHHPTFFCQSAEWKHSRIQLVSERSQAVLEERAGLFKGFKSTRPDAELCGIPFIPSTQCPGQWYPSYIRWAGEILGLSAGRAAKIRPAAMNLHVRQQEWNAASQARYQNNRRDQYPHVVTVSVVLGGVGSSMVWYHTPSCSLSRKRAHYWDQMSRMCIWLLCR